jgi:hypothetical protein
MNEMNVVSALTSSAHGLFLHRAKHEEERIESVLVQN